MFKWANGASACVTHPLLNIMEIEYLISITMKYWYILEVPECKDDEDLIIMKITGVLVDYLVEIALEVYADYIVIEKGKQVL